MNRMPGLALYRGVSWISRAIRWQTRSVYSHAAIIDLRSLDVWESWQGVGVGGPHSVGAWHTPGTQVDVYEVAPGLTEEQAARVIGYAEAQVGRGYDYLGVLRFLTRRPPGFNDERLFCSELAFEAFAAGGRRLLHRIGASEVAPAHLSWSPYLRLVRTVYTSNTPGSAKMPQDASTPKPATTPLASGQTPIAAPLPEIVEGQKARIWSLMPRRRPLPPFDPLQPLRERMSA